MEIIPVIDCGNLKTVTPTFQMGFAEAGNSAASHSRSFVGPGCCSVRGTAVWHLGPADYLLVGRALSPLRLPYAAWKPLEERDKWAGASSCLPRAISGLVWRYICYCSCTRDAGEHAEVHEDG